MARTLPLLSKLLCWLGFHDFHVVGKSFVGSKGGIETKECRRCGLRMTS